jgi:hypothetical protein
MWINIYIFPLICFNIMEKLIIMKVHDTTQKKIQKKFLKFPPPFFWCIKNIHVKSNELKF